MKKSKTKNDLVQLAIATTDGEFAACYSGRGLASLSFPFLDGTRTAPSDGSVSTQVKEWHRVAAAALRQALGGRAPRILPPLDLSSGTAFQQRVWNALREIPTGQTRSYGEIAKQIGKPQAVRAVGGACGANPIPVFVACHRVLAANHKIGGFSGGLVWKHKLLEREGVQVESS